MYRNNHKQFSIALVAGCLMALAGPAAASAAETPSADAEVHVGQIGAGANSEQVRSETNTQVQRTQETSVAAAQRTLTIAQTKLRETQSRLQRIERQLRTELSSTKAKADREVAIRRAYALRTASKLNTQVKQLRIQVMRASIALASSTAEGAWVAVNRSGDVLNQSGGASVDHNGRGRYTVQFDTSRDGCANVAGSNPSPSGNSGSIRVTSLGGGTFSVLLYDAGRRSNGGFFLALSC